MAYDDWTANTSKKYIYKWRKIVPYTNGHILRDLGLPSGSAYKTILQTLKAAWLDDKIHTKEEEQALLKILLKEKGDFLKN
jgi:hypothetical protein